MHRTYHSFSVLQATAAIVAMAIVLWSLGLSSIRFAEAANVTTFSDTLSSSAPATVSNHTIEFTTPSGVANTETITLDFSDGPFVLGSVDYTDFDVSTTSGDYVLAASCGAGGDQIGVDVSSWPTVTMTFCSGEAGASIPANGTTTIQIGTNATGGDAQLTNPAGTSSREILLTAGVDSGATRVAMVDSVTISASVDTVFNFTVSAVQGGQPVNGATTGGTTTPTEIPFGTLDAGVASTAAQDLLVVTNASNGFVVRVVSDGQLESQTGADIDGFRNGQYETTSQQWESPTPALGDERTYGHWGITSNDDTLGSGLTDLYDVGGNGENYVSASTTPVEVFRHNGPVDGTITGEGTARVGYTVEITSLQEAADDYQAVLTYIATPVF